MASGEGGKAANGNCGCAIDEMPGGDRSLVMDHQFRTAIRPILKMRGSLQRCCGNPVQISNDRAFLEPQQAHSRLAAIQMPDTRPRSHLQARWADQRESDPRASINLVPQDP